MRKKTIDDEKLRGRNLEIYEQYFVQKVPIRELSQKYDLTPRQVFRCLRFIKKELPTIPEPLKISGYISNSQSRTRDLMKLRKEELEREKPSIRSICELETQVRENQEVEMRLEGLLREAIKFEVSNQDGSIVKILKEITREKNNN